MAATDTHTVTRQETKTPNLWKVVLHNDDYTPMEFVVRVLVDLFDKPLDEAQRLMLTVHERGKASVSVYTREVAMAKTSMVNRIAADHGHPLLTTCEVA